MKQAKIIDSDNICTIVTQKGMWEQKYQSVHTIKKMLFTKLILDTAVTSEDLSHTTMTTIYVRKFTGEKCDKNKNMYKCNWKISQNDKNILVQDIHHSILYTTLSIYK